MKLPFPDPAAVIIVNLVTMNYSGAVVLNQGAAESSRGAANFQTLLVLTSKLQLRVLPNC